MTHEEFLAAAVQLQPTYQPSTETRDRIAQVDFVPIIGPSGVGKSTLIKRLGLHLVMSDMTRDIRPGEVDAGDAFFRKDYDRMYEELQAGEFVQIAIGPDGEFYATRANSYPPRGPALMPMVASVLPVMRQLGFKSVTPLYIVAPSFEEWLRRFETMGHTPDRRAKRLQEAQQSLELALADESMTFVLNDAVEEATETIRLILSGADYDDKIARKAAQAMLEAMRQFSGQPV